MTNLRADWALRGPGMTNLRADWVLRGPGMTNLRADWASRGPGMTNPRADWVLRDPVGPIYDTELDRGDRGRVIRLSDYCRCDWT